MEYLLDLGLIRREPGGRLTIANPIYREIIPRELTWVLQSDIHQEQQWYLQPDGRLDMPKLLTAFQTCFREHSEHWIERFQYKEAGPQLLLQAFLQRIVNVESAIMPAGENAFQDVGDGIGRRADLSSRFGDCRLPPFEVCAPLDSVRRQPESVKLRHPRPAGAA